MNLASTASQTHSLGQPPFNSAIVSSDKDEEDFQTVADKIHNDNFNFKLKVHMLNKLLDENKGTISADSKVKEDLRSMERKIELSQRRYDRLVRNRRRQKNRVDKGYGAPLGYDGLSKISRNNNIIGKMNENSSNQNDDGMSFSAVERKQKDVEQRFRDQFGSQLLLPASTHERQSNPGITQPYISALPPVAPKFSTLFGGLENGDGQELKSGRIEELLSSPQLPQITGKNIWNARKTTRFANTNGSTISPPRTPLKENQIGNNTTFKNTINVNNNTNKILPKFDDLSLTDSDDPFSITEDQEPVNFNRSGNTGIGVRNRGIWISDTEYEEFRQLKKINIRQNQKIEEQENEIYRLRSEIRTRESELNINKFSNNIDNATNRVDFFSNLRRRKNFQSNAEVNSNRNKTIKGLTWVYDSIKSIQGIPPNLLSTFQDCIIDITYNFDQKDSQINPPVQSSSAIAKVQPLESITESQQLAVYQYELNRTKQRLSDLIFSTEIKSRQIEVYQAANKTRIQLMHSLGLIPSADSNNLNNNHNKHLHGNNYNWYSYRNKLLLTNAERQKLQEKFRAAIYYVIAARRFVQRLDDKMIEKDRLRQRLVDLGINGSGNTRAIGQAESVNNLLRF